MIKYNDSWPSQSRFILEVKKHLRLWIVDEHAKFPKKKRKMFHAQYQKKLTIDWTNHICQEKKKKKKMFGLHSFSFIAAEGFKFVLKKFSNHFFAVRLAWRGRHIQAPSTADIDICSRIIGQLIRAPKNVFAWNL